MSLPRLTKSRRTFWKRRAVARLQPLFTGIGDEGQFAGYHIDELVFFAMPVALAGPRARRPLLQVDAKVRQAPGMPERLLGAAGDSFGKRRRTVLTAGHWDGGQIQFLHQLLLRTRKS
jgi:hypothetical protein